MEMADSGTAATEMNDNATMTGSDECAQKSSKGKTKRILKEQ